MRPPRLRCTLFPLIYPPHLLGSYKRQLYGFVLFGRLTKRNLASYVISVRRTKSLLTASFRFYLTIDTLAVQLYTSLSPRHVRDFHPLERAHGAQTKNTAVALSHSRMYLISTTHSFLISYRFFFSLAPYLSSTPRLPHHIYGREHHRRMLRFAPLADFLKVLLITTWSPSSSFLRRISYHYPPPMILAKDLQKSIHSYKESLRMRTGTDSFLTK